MKAGTGMMEIQITPAHDAKSTSVSTFDREDTIGL